MPCPSHTCHAISLAHHIDAISLAHHITSRDLTLSILCYVCALFIVRSLWFACYALHPIIACYYCLLLWHGIIELYYCVEAFGLTACCTACCTPGIARHANETIHHHLIDHAFIDHGLLTHHTYGVPALATSLDKLAKSSLGMPWHMSWHALAHVSACACHAFD